MGTANGSAPVVVVGGGAVGLCAAFYLQRSGLPVIVVERDDLGAGASSGNAGWVCLSHSAPVPAPGVAWYAARLLGQPDSPLYVRPPLTPDFLAWLVDFMRHCRRSAFERGYAAVARFNQRTLELFDELGTAGVTTGLRRLGIVHAFLSADEAAHQLELQRQMAWAGYSVPASPEEGARARHLDPALSNNVKAAYMVEGEGVLDPMHFLTSLGERLRSAGVQLLENAAVTSVERQGRCITGVIVAGKMVACSALVVAAGVWSTDVVHPLGIRLPLQAGKGYSFSVALDPAPQHALLLGDRRIAVSPIGGTIRLAGTMEFSGNNRRLDWRRIVAIANGSRPYLGRWFEQATELPSRIRDPWVGGRPMLPDGLPVIDAIPTVDNAYVATGHGMLGITLAPVTGEAVARLIVEGKRPAVIEPFRLDRFRRTLVAA
jgi:D-amino-acid dehydrogenase